MLRSIGAVLGGYLAYLILSIIGGVILALSFPGVVSSGILEPTPGYLVGSLIFSFIFAVVSGYITASIAQSAIITHALGLGVLMVVLGLISLIIGSNPQPIWSQIVSLIIPIPSVYLGGMMRSRRKIATASAEQAPV